jgi:hypothetical protein
MQVPRRHINTLLALCCVSAALVLAGCPRHTRSVPQTRQSPPTEPATLAATQMPPAPADGMSRVLAPPRGCLYHGFHPGGADGDESVVLREPGTILSYKGAVGHDPAFVYFSHEWGHDKDRAKDVVAHAFPLEQIEKISEGGRIPFVRLMLRTSSAEAFKKREKYFTLENMLGTGPNNKEQQRIRADIETDLRVWGRRAREEYRKPLIVEWGTEANNRTFHWNADNHAGDKRQATALFRRAFRYVVHAVSGDHPEQSNIVWVFHVTAESDPDTTEEKYRGDDWNRMGEYFPDGAPGEAEDDVVDWIGVSVYGTTNLDTGKCTPFSTQLKDALGSAGGTGGAERLLALAGRGRTRHTRPIFVLELGTALNYGETKNPFDECRPQTWITEAFKNIFRRGDEGTLAGFSWWNERYDDEGSKTLELRFDHLPETSEPPGNIRKILDAYRSALDDARVAHAPSESARGSQACRVLTSGVGGSR